MAVRALAEELLACGVVGKMRDGEREPAVCGQLPGELARIGLPLEDERPDRRRPGQLDRLGPIAKARPAGAEVIRARLERRERPTAVGIGVDGRLPRERQVACGDERADHGTAALVDGPAG